MMQLFTALSTVGFGSIGCVRVACMTFILLVWSMYLNKEGFRSKVLPDSSASSVTVPAASGPRQPLQEADIEGAAPPQSAQPYFQRKSSVHAHLYSPKKMSTPELEPKQRSVGAFKHERDRPRGSTSEITRAPGVPHGNVHRNMTALEEVSRKTKVTIEPGRHQGFARAGAERSLSAPRAERTTLQRNDTPTGFSPLPPPTQPLRHSESFPGYVSLQVLHRSSALRADPAGRYTCASIDAEATPGGTSSFSSPFPVKALTDTRELARRLPQELIAKQTHNASTSTPLDFACTRGSCKRYFSSFLDISGSSQGALPWLSTTVPRACKYAGCKAGKLRPRDASDEQDCFSFVHCSQCPLHPVGHVEFCSKLEEERNYVLLMQSTLRLMPLAVLPFHYGAARAADEATPPGQQEGGEARVGVEPGGRSEIYADYDEEYAGSVYAGDRTFLQVRSQAGVPVHQPLLRVAPATVHRTRRGTREQNSTTQDSNSSLREKPIPTVRFTLSSLLQDEIPRRMAFEYHEESERGIERDVQFGQWEDESSEQPIEHEIRTPSKVKEPSAASPAELLKFEQSFTYRVQKAEILMQLDECATSAEGKIRLLLMLVFQRMRPKMSVQEVRQRLGLSTTAGGAPRAEESEAEGQLSNEPEDEEDAPRPDADAGPAPGGAPSPAYVQQCSFSDEQEDSRWSQTSSSPLQHSIAPPTSSPLQKGPDFRSIDHSSHVGVPRCSRCITEPQTSMGKSESAGVDFSAVSSNAGLPEEYETSRLSLRNRRASFLQSGDTFEEQGSFEGADWQPEEKKSLFRDKFLGRVKSLFRSRIKKDEDVTEWEHTNEPGDEAEPQGGRNGLAGRKGGISRVKRFFGRLLRKKTREQEQELKKKKTATRVLVNAPRVHVEVAVISPAVRKCRKPLMWSGRLRLSTMLQVQYFISVRKADIEGQLPGFINNALRVVIRCESRNGCVMNRDLQSCVLVSCAKHKTVSREAAAAKSKIAEALARSQLKLAQSGSGGILSEEERAARAATFVKNTEEKQHALEAQELREHQQILTVEEQHNIIHRQLANLSTAKPNAMQLRLLDAIGAQERETPLAELTTTPPVIKEATHPVVGLDAVKLSKFSPPTSEEKTQLTPAAIAVIAVVSAVGVLGVGTIACWWYLKRQETGQSFLFRCTAAQGRRP